MNFKKINFLNETVRNIALTIFSSFLIFLSYPKISISSLAFVALIPFILVIFNIKSLKNALKYGFVFGFTTYLFLLYWIYITLRAGDVNLLFSILGLILLCLILSVEFIIITIITFYAKQYGTVMMIFVLPSVWVLVDFFKVAITRYIPYFPWFQISYSQWNNPYILNLAYFGQSYSITFLIVFINALLASIFLEKEKKQKIKRFITAFIIILVSIIVGRMRYYDIETAFKNSKESIKIATIQPSIDFYLKWDLTSIDYIQTRIEALLKEVETKKPSLIIWPENALYGWIDDPAVFSWLCSSISSTKTNHIVGSVSKNDNKHVSLYYIDQKCEIKNEYNKRMLVPFGEYVPMRKFLGKYISAITGLGEFSEGSMSQKPYEFIGFKIGNTICYETVFNYLFYPDSDVDFFVNITNDGWYLDTSAPYQHFAAAVMRSAETARPLVRSANNGISAVIYPNGRIYSKLDLNEYGYIISELKKIDFPRPNDTEKNLTVYISLMITIAFAIAMLFRR
ncbi:MAG: apolipoprotein N-acyltransferase [Elusimicrobiales bacterium]|jgi:apolipoprotein N-acyltransferase|nr:apolipoprotein N-acyltransferase [Elusimicrobiales bacterium]